MIAPQVKCPSCGSTSGLATVETVYYHAPIATKDGEVVFTDEPARIFWETSETQVAPDGNPLIHCHDCDHEWAEARLREQLGSAEEGGRRGAGTDPRWRLERHPLVGL